MKALGIDVLTPDHHKIAGPSGNWWDINDIVWRWTKIFGDEDAHLKALKGRFNETSDGNLAKLLYECGGVGSQNLATLTGVSMNLGAVGSTVNHGQSPNQRRQPLKGIGNLTVATTKFDACVKEALKCLNPSCVKYQEQILPLLRSFGKTIIRMNTCSKKKQQEWGLDALPNKVKAHTKNQFGEDYIELAIVNGPDSYKGNCSAHAEILAGIRFEAGNVHAGVSDLATDKQLAAEAPVTLRDSQMAALRAKEGYPITQQEWRNLVTVFFSDVNLATFTMTPAYLANFTGTPHAQVGNYGTGQTKK